MGLNVCVTAMVDGVECMCGPAMGVMFFSCQNVSCSLHKANSSL